MSLARRFDRTIALTAGLAFALLLVGLLGPAVAAAAPAGGHGSSVVRFQDYTLLQGRTVESVVVIHGNAVIGGTVRRSVVVVGGNATIESTAVVGADETARASSVVVVGGHLTIEPGAAVRGKTTQVTGVHLEGVVPAILSSVAVRPIGVVAGWWQLLFLPIVALVVAALFPRAVSRVSDRVHAKFWPSFGWGIIGLLAASVLLVVLAITIIGLILVVPAGLALPAVLLFCFVGTAALVGRLVLSSSPRYRDNVLVAAVVGALLVSLVSLVPIIGGLAVLVATMAGFGAALTLVNEWRLARRSTAAPAAAGPPPLSTPPGWTSPPGWTPQPPPGWSWSPQQGWSPPAPGAGVGATPQGSTEPPA